MEEFVKKLKVINDAIYNNEVHVIQFTCFGIQGWHKPLEKIIEDMKKGTVMDSKDDTANNMKHRVFVKTDNECYYCATI